MYVHEHGCFHIFCRFLLCTESGFLCFHFLSSSLQGWALGKEHGKVEDDFRGGCSTRRGRERRGNLRHPVQCMTEVACPWCPPSVSPKGLLSIKTSGEEKGCRDDELEYAPWSRETRACLTQLVIHLRSFHSDFSYDLFLDRELGVTLHVAVKTMLPGLRAGTDDPKTAHVAKKPSQLSRKRGRIDELESEPPEPELDNRVPIALSFFSEGGRGAFFAVYGGSGRRARQLIASRVVDRVRIISSKRMLCEGAEKDKSVSDRVTTGGDVSERFGIAPTLDKGRVYYTAFGQVERSVHGGCGYSPSGWLTDHTNRVIADYEDVNLNEKVFMAKWNEHVEEFPVYADLWMPRVAEKFATLHAHYLAKHSLRYVFLLHLISLWDHSLLSLEHVELCITILDRYISDNNSSVSNITVNDA